MRCGGRITASHPSGNACPDAAIADFRWIMPQNCCAFVTAGRLITRRCCVTGCIPVVGIRAATLPISDRIRAALCIDRGVAMMNGWDMSGWGWAWMSLTMIVGAVLVALLAVMLFRGSGSPPRSQQGDDPVEILGRRLARGEIDEDEYRRRRTALGSSGESPLPS
jgi:putative membrane protein